MSDLNKVFSEIYHTTWSSVNNFISESVGDSIKSSIVDSLIFSIWKSTACSVITNPTLTIELHLQTKKL